MKRIPSLLSATSIAVFAGMSAAIGFSAIAQQGGEKEKDRPTPYLKCERLSWVENCSELDRIARENPGQPIRLTTPEGLEMFFKADTPMAMIEHQLNPSMETARRLLKHQQAYMQQMDKATDLMQQALLEDGTLLSNQMGRGIAMQSGLMPESLLPKSDAIATQLKNTPINYSKVRVYVLLDSTCGVCKELVPELSAIAQQHPKLDLRLLQLDDDRNFVNHIAQFPNLEIGMPSVDDRLGLIQRIKGTPTIWIEQKGTNRTTVIEGWRSAANLIAEISAASQGAAR